MDSGTPKAGGGKAVLPVPVVPAGSDDGDAAAASSARAARRKTTTSLPAAAAAAEAEDDDDDELVERFYALLDNIRAMRGVYGSGADSVETGGGVVEAGNRKRRLRGSEPPWRPAFRLEDFEEPSPTSSSSDAAPPCAKRQQQQEAGGEGTASASASPSRRAGAARVDSGRKSI